MNIYTIQYLAGVVLVGLLALAPASAQVLQPDDSVARLAPRERVLIAIW